MKNLHISDDLSLPLEAVTNTHLILARRRVGKSYTAAVMAEEMIKAGLPWVALDPTGVWWGLTSSADGKSEGLPVIVIGGPHGHIPLEPSAGKVIANLVIDHPGWYVIDFSRFNNASDERRFSADFGVQLYRRKQRHPSALHLFVDEADMFVPQKLPKDGKAMFDAFDAIVRRGGVYGLGVTLITQRPAIVNKDVTTQCETLIALQTTAPQDQDPVFDWVSRNGTDEQLKEIKKTLAGLKVGQAWFFSPNSDVFKLIKIRTRDTFNSSATPKPGAKPIEPKVFANIDIQALGEEITATVERSKQEDPEFLRRQISQLKQDLAVKHLDAAPAKPTIERVEVPVITDEQLQSLEDYLSGVSRVTQEFREIRLQIEQLFNGKIDGLNTTALSLSSAIEAAKKVRTMVQPTARVTAVTEPVRKPQFQVALPLDVSGTLPEGENKILSIVAQYPNGVTPQQLTVLTGYRRSTRNTYLQRLGQKGAIEKRGNRILITDAGRGLVQVVPLPTGEELRAYWLQELPAGERAVMEILYDAHPGDVDREEIDQRTGYSRSTRNTYIQRMIAKELVTVTGSGRIKASDHLYQ